MFPAGRDPFRRGAGCAKGCHTRDLVVHRLPPNGFLVLERPRARGAIHNQIEMPILDQINDVRTALVDLQPYGALDSRSPHCKGGTSRGVDLETQGSELACYRQAFGPFRLGHTDENRSFVRQRGTGTQLRLGERFAKRLADTHYFAGRTHFRPQDRVDAGELVKRENRRFHTVLGHRKNALGQVVVAQLLANHQADCNLRQRIAGRLTHVRHGPRGSRIDFDHIDLVFVNRVLNVHQTPDIQRFRQPHRVVADCRKLFLGNRR